MTTGEPTGPQSAEPVRVEWEDVVRFIRQLSHDLRNRLNAAELQAAYVGEVSTDPALKDEIKRLRQTVSEFGRTLQEISASVAPVRPNMMQYGAADFLEDVRRKLNNEFPKEGPAVVWDVQLEGANLEIDPQLLQQALLEIFANALRDKTSGAPLHLVARIDDGKAILTLREPKESFALSTENWGREPLRSIRQGHYGLGLHRVRAILESHGGRLCAQYDKTSATLVTTLTLPLEPRGQLRNWEIRERRARRRDGIDERQSPDSHYR